MATVLEPKIDRSSAAGSSDRSFGFVFATVFACIAALPLLHHQAPRWWALAGAVAFALVSFVEPKILHPLNRGWIFLGNLLHRVISPIVMGAIFFLCISPIAWVMRLRGKDILSLVWRPDLKSYWIARDHSQSDPESMRTQY
jgi:hypothetical protein